MLLFAEYETTEKVEVTELVALARAESSPPFFDAHSVSSTR
jgi:hypothetical protein